MSKYPVVFIPVKCNKTGKDFFVREDLAADGVWTRTYGVTSVSSDAVSSGGGETEINYSNHRVGPQYKCPHCGNKRLFLCEDCGRKACCYDGKATEWKCPIDSTRHGNFSSEKVSSISGSKGEGQ